MRKVFVVCLLITVLLCGTVWASQSKFRHELNLQTNTTYAISVWMQGEDNAEATMTVNFLDRNGQRLDFVQVSRGLGIGGNWQPIGLEVITPSSFARAELIVSADKPGEYQWERLSVNVVEREMDKVREYWEERFDMYGEVYTGLVVDGRHLNLTRGMSPRVYSESGQLIYGGVLASMDIIQNYGVVAYGREMTPELYKRIQVDPNYPYALPLVVKAQSVVDPANTSVYISDEDAQRILEALVKYDFLARYAVVFLIP